MVIKMSGTSIAAYRMCLRAFFCMVNPMPRAYPLSPRDYLSMRL